MKGKESMKRFFIPFLMVAISSLPVSAADLPTTKSPPPVAADLPYNWTGLYLGANVGYAWGSDCWFTINANAGEACNHANGLIGGGQVGYNWQVRNLVLGVEGTGDLGSLKGGHLSPIANPAANVILNSETDNIVTAAARLGVAWNNVLLYGKGGAAWVGSKYNENAFAVTATAASATRAGWIVGAGVDYGITKNVSLGVEYNYIGLSGANLPFSVVSSGFGFTPFETYPVDSGGAHSKSLRRFGFR